MKQSFSQILKSLISKGVTSVKIVLNAGSQAKLYVLHAAGWRFQCMLERHEVIASLKEASNHTFCANKLIDRLKLPSESLGESIGSAVLRSCPLSFQSESHLTISGLRAIKS